MSLSSMRKRNTNNKQDTVKPQPVSESKELQFSSQSNITPLFGLCIVLCLAIPLAYLSDDWLPTPLPASILPSQFSEERALTHLHAITTFGVRTVGSNANENLTPNYILNFVDSVRAHAPDGVDIEAETQRPSGSFTSWFLGGFTNVYDQVTNVVVRVSFTGARHRQNALLVSAHFDTALGTVAASDDAANIAAMMECLRNIVHGEALPHAVIFIFNGAEETNWQAAHGFITQHRWSKTIRSVINLEGSGAGGRAMVVQTGPRHAWLVEAFQRVAPRPHASTMAQEIFQSKVIPGWTDFETYVEFSKHEIAGIDMVFIRNGYVYHTDIDDEKHVTPGTLQHLGNNLLPTIRELASSPYLVDAVHYKDKTAIFWDLAGLFLIVFPDATVARVWYCILLFSVIVQRFFDYQHNNKSPSLLQFGVHWFQHCLLQTVVFLFGVAISLLVGSLFMLLGCSMTWFSSLYTTWLLYGASSLTGTLLGRMVVDRCLSDTKAAASTLWWCLLFVAVYFNAQSSYVPAVPLFFQMVGSIVHKIGRKRHAIQIDLISGMIVHVIPSILLSQYYCTIGTFFVPITGRIGDTIPSDLLVAALLGVAGSLLWVVPTASLHGTKYNKYQPERASLPFVFRWASVVTGIVLVYLLNQIPYTKERRKRLYVQQLARTTYEPWLTVQETPRIKEYDQGLWVNAFDKRGLTEDVATFDAIDELTIGRQHVTCEHDKVYCGFPWYFPVQEMLRNQWYVPVLDTPFPTKDETFQLSMVSKTDLDGGGKRLEFLATGPSHMTVVIEGELKRWSFTKDRVPYKSSESCKKAMLNRQNDCRFVFYSTGQLGTSNWTFWLETSSGDDAGSVGLTLAFYGHYGLDVMAEGETLSSVRSQLPDWLTMVSWVSHWHQYEF